MDCIAKGESDWQGHGQIFSTFLKTPKPRYIVRSIRFLRDDVAIVPVDASMVKKSEAYPDRLRLSRVSYGEGQRAVAGSRVL